MAHGNSSRGRYFDDTETRVGLLRCRSMVAMAVLFTYEDVNAPKIQSDDAK